MTPLQEAELRNFRQAAFRYSLNEAGYTEIKSMASCYSREVEAGSILKKHVVSQKNYEAARFIEDEIIRPNKRMLSALSIVRFIFVDGIGRIPPFPYELLPELRQIDARLSFT